MAAGELLDEVSPTPAIEATQRGERAVLGVGAPAVIAIRPPAWGPEGGSQVAVTIEAATRLRVTSGHGKHKKIESLRGKVLLVSQNGK